MHRFTSKIKQLLPGSLRIMIRRLIAPKGKYGYEHDLGMYVLDKTREFSKKIGGKPVALENRELMEAVFRQKHINYMNQATQHLQAVFMSNMEKNLFEFYYQQQYLILLTFLSYPFRGPGCLFDHVQPFIDASTKLDVIKTIDYGCGLPFGLIHLMRTRPEKVNSITIVDQALIHMELAEYILSQLCSQTKLAVTRTTDAESLADLGDRTFNLIYGKDIFEHLPQPERVMRALLDRAEAPCFCYLDINDHEGLHLQHVNPRLSNLAKVIRDHAFTPMGQIGKLFVFVKTA